MKRIILTIPCLMLLITGCQEAKKKVGTSIMEKAIEAASGKKIDALDANNIENNNAIVDVTINGENLQNHFKKGYGSITASKETIAITITGGENGQDNILLGFIGKDLTAERPIKGKMIKGENAGFTFSIMKVIDNGMDAQLSYEAEGEIVSLQKEKIVIKIKGKTRSSADSEKSENWKSYEGTITLFHPIFQAIGNSKEDFVY